MSLNQVYTQREGENKSLSQYFKIHGIRYLQFESGSFPLFILDNSFLFFSFSKTKGEHAPRDIRKFSHQTRCRCEKICNNEVLSIRSVLSDDLQEAVGDLRPASQPERGGAPGPGGEGAGLGQPQARPTPPPTDGQERQPEVHLR